MKRSRKVERALQRAERALDRLEAAQRHGRLTPAAFLDATPAIRDYLAAVDRELERDAEAARTYAAERSRVLERTRLLAVAVGLGALWDETMGGPGATEGSATA